MDKRFLAVLAVLSLAVFLLGCSALPAGGGQAKEMSFEEGLSKIKAIFAEEGVKMPDFSKSMFVTDKGLAGLGEIKLQEGFKEKSPTIRAKIEGFKNGLSEYKQTEDIAALSGFSDFLVSVFDFRIRAVGLVESGKLAKVGEEIETMQDINKYCLEPEEQSLEGIESLLKEFGGAKPVGEKCESLVSGYPSQAEKAGIKPEFCAGFKKAIAMTSSFEEILPLLGEMCTQMKEASALGESKIFADQAKMCEYPEKTKQELREMAFVMERFATTMKKISGVLEKYPEAQTEQFSVQKIGEFLAQVKEYNELLDRMEPLIDTVCSANGSSE